MDIRKMYQDKLVSASEAAKTVKSGDWVDYGWCACHPVSLDRALAARASEELTDVNIRGGIALWKPAICRGAKTQQSHFTWNSWHMSGIERKMIAQGMAYYAPHPLFRAAALSTAKMWSAVGRGNVPGGADGRARLL